MSPEQTYLGRRVDGRADLYSLGLSLFETLVGLHPYPTSDGVEPVELMRMHREHELPRLMEVLPELPAAVTTTLDAVLEQACAKDPEARFASASAMKAALGQVRPG